MLLKHCLKWKAAYSDNTLRPFSSYTSIAETEEKEEKIVTGTQGRMNKLFQFLTCFKLKQRFTDDGDVEGKQRFTDDGAVEWNQTFGDDGAAKPAMRHML